MSQFDDYHRWYYERRIHEATTFLGVQVLKFIGDLWSYQEIIYGLRPSLIVEMGTHVGGSALWFAETVRSAGLDCRVLTVDIDCTRIVSAAWRHPNIEILSAHSVDDKVAHRIRQLRGERPGPLLASLDSDHGKPNVLAELQFLRSLTGPGDYVVVEDGNINGHPVEPTFGEGPREALDEYMRTHPDDYRRDTERETKFGLTFAPGGYLQRC